MEKVGQLNLAENSMKLNIFKKYPQKANRISIWAFLLSIFIYISIFYIFNLSLSTLFNTPRFWFFISNTLILIIAVDSGAFSSSKYQNFSELDHVKQSPPGGFTSMELHYCNNNNNIAKQSNINISIPQQGVDHQNSEESEFQENKLEVVVKNVDHPEKATDSTDLEENKPKITTKPNDEKKNEGRYIRSESEKAIPVENNNEKKIILRRSETEKHEQNEDEENEFSSMSDEELNRRVEEFIRRFNRQIRLQAAERNNLQQI